MAAVPTDSLIYYYKFASSLVDSWGVNDLTATNSPTYASGIIGQGLDLESGSAQHLNCTDNANLSTGDINFSGDIWVKLESKAVQMLIVGKATGATMEYILEYAQIQDRFRFYIRSGGGTFVVVDADNLGSPSLGVWYHIYYEHDATNNFVRIRVNGGTANSTATSGTAPPDTASPLRFGYLGSGSNYLDGVIDEAAFWKRVLTNQEQLDRYNGGAGNTLVLDEISITRPRSPEIVQRTDGSGGDITFTGTYTAAASGPTAIEARVVWDNPSHTGNWTVIDSSPTGGEYSGTLSGQPVGSGQVEVRWANDTGVTATATSVGIGRVFVTGGQSNMQGRADNQQTLTNPGSQLALMFREDDTSWLPLADPTNSDAVYGTLIPHVATQMLSEDPDCPIGFITACDGGTSILISPFEWRIPDGASYVDLLASVTLADPPAIEGVLWLQGEAEAYFDYSTDAYYAAVSTVLNAFHGLPGNPWVMVGQIGMLPASEVAGAQAIRQAQRNTWNIPYVRRGPAWHHLDLSVDQLHARTDAESEAQGVLWGKALGGATTPVMTSVQATSGATSVVITYDQALTTDASLSTAPWSLSSGQTVTGAAASGSTVTLTVTPANAGPVPRVTHASANTAVGVDVPLSTAGLPAAAETFPSAAGLNSTSPTASPYILPPAHLLASRVI